jgi:hypothetical protein
MATTNAQSSTENKPVEDKNGEEKKTIAPLEEDDEFEDFPVEGPAA